MSDAGSDAASEEEVIPRIILKKEQIQDGCLSQLQRSVSGSSYGYTSLIIEAKDIQELGEEIKDYNNLRFIQIKGNEELESVKEIAYLPYLLKLVVNENPKVTSITFFNENPQMLQYLQIVDFSQNALTELPNLPLPSLSFLKLSSNAIASCTSFTGHSALKILDLKANKLTSCEGIKDLTALEALYIGENEITSIAPLSNMPVLTRLHVRKNAITTLADMPDLPSLQYFNARENPIEKFEDIEQFYNFSELKVVNMLATTAAEQEGFKKEILIKHPDL